jgi:hypothetical protein
MIRPLVLGAMAAVFWASQALAESWYLIDANGKSMELVDRDSIRWRGTAFITTISINAIPAPVGDGRYVQMTQGIWEFDCKNRTDRLAEMSMLTVTRGEVTHDKFNDAWEPVDMTTNIGVMFKMTCMAQANEDGHVSDFNSARDNYLKAVADGRIK